MPDGAHWRGGFIDSFPLAGTVWSSADSGQCIESPKYDNAAADQRFGVVVWRSVTGPKGFPELLFGFEEGLLYPLNPLAGFSACCKCEAPRCIRGASGDCHLRWRHFIALPRRMPACYYRLKSDAVGSFIDRYGLHFRLHITPRSPRGDNSGKFRHDPCRLPGLPRPEQPSNIMSKVVATSSLQAHPQKRGARNGEKQSRQPD